MNTAPSPPGPVRIGCAGWSLSRSAQGAFAQGNNVLQRYATRLPMVEINSSFYRPHLPSTYARWAASVPDHFRFAVKMPRSISHEHRLRDAMPPLQRFLDGVLALGDRLGPLLLQLPPSLAYDPATAEGFLQGLRARTEVDVACEPRHPSWFTTEVDALLSKHRVARVAADPARAPSAAIPGGDRTWSYWRWHGQPQIYRSAYSEQALAGLARALQLESDTQRSVWFVLDNTALGHATSNALRLQTLLQEGEHA
ncbi:DUF72 domain-containing protein [Stenotrophomonas maltophilia]|uniref:DUF72 domain-containing protein n=1 Tax=Stenotrophomonas TaxID=40323 RepID=UPI000E7DA270|nr:MULTISPECIES: DUF72 domain-containing protein [Stenotrophomonas]HBK51100.1 DUF72 domain-containing protein [Pseudomonas sp.]ELC7320659.1 DUF72 domain-containing protein [Stenotrophomonas maltophilia]MBA0275214.1 DUF72 domain-containing protein [Stenotrophomonas maltophilia]MBA0411084.1 DUF72 domain-containing protein [Stenotrophomonas maltophilia]MBA0496592.1 DUF72 domain-containing protein [Stenotrophomonas maltophilia]